jgi:predicted DsbA family dithiol-disulfide isomerase
MRITILSDTICPWCFIGKRRFERALSMRPELKPQVSWQPFQLNPTMPREGIDRRQYLAAKFGGVDRAERQYDRIRQVGREEGISFDFERIGRTPNTVNAHRLVHLAGRAGLQDDVVEGLFGAYFTEGRDIGEVAVLAEIAAACGLDRAGVARYLAGDEDRASILALDDSARRNGITGVPCFVVEDKYAISGAQSPEIFHQIFDLVRQEARYLTGQSAAE